MNPEKIKEDFPVFKDDSLCYLDNAATTQKPRKVIDRLNTFYEKENSNIGRGLYSLASKATQNYERARKNIADFINADPEEIIFVRNSTEAMNLLASSLEFEGDIMLPDTSHHSSQLPWREKYPERINFLPVNENNELILSKAQEKITKETSLTCIAQITNTTGIEQPIKEITRLNHENNSLVIVDGAQSVPRKPVDVKKMDIDFLVFSGHKMLGPTGIGVLYGKKELLKEMKPYQVGGGMVKSVTKTKIRYEDPPHKFEAGTPHIAGVLGLSAAVDYLENIGMEEVYQHDITLSERIEEEIEKIDGFNVFPPKDKLKCLVSFTCDFAHPHDLAELLAEEKIAVRAGHHCAQPLMEEKSKTGTVRASPYIYNSKEDIEGLVKSLKKAKNIFKK